MACVMFTCAICQAGGTIGYRLTDGKAGKANYPVNAPALPWNPINPIRPQDQDTDEQEDFYSASWNGTHQLFALQNADSAEGEVKKHLDKRQNSEDTAVWIAPFFRHSSTHGLGDGIHSRSNSTGSAFGIDFPFGDLVLGTSFSGGHSKSTYRDKNSSSDEKSDFFGLTLYADWQADELRLYGGAGYFRDEHDLKIRNILERHSASCDTNTYSAFALAEYTLETQAVDIRPYVGVRYALVDSDSYRIARGFTCDTDKQNVVRFPVGIKFDKNFDCRSGFSVRPVLDLCLEPACGDTKVETRLRANGYSASEKSRVLDALTYSAFLGMNANWGSIEFLFGYGFQGSSHEKTHGVSCGFNWEF